MPRAARSSVGGLNYHVLNGGNGRADVSYSDDDDVAFVALLRKANQRPPIRLLSHARCPTTSISSSGHWLKANSTVGGRRPGIAASTSAIMEEAAAVCRATLGIIRSNRPLAC